MNDAHLRVYLNDHMAGATAAVELIKHCLNSNPTGPLGVFLGEVLGEIQEDRDVLKDLLARIDGRNNPVKQTMAWLVDKVNRAKMNNELFTYSDLSRLEELEGLVLGIQGKLALWSSLEAASLSDGRFSDIDFYTLKMRAQQQYDRAESHRIEAALKAFTSSADKAANRV